jgi:hypothetical protein
MNGVKLVRQKCAKSPLQHVQRIGLNKLERVMRLGRNVHANNLEPRPVVTHGCPTRTAEQVEQPHQLNPQEQS